MKPAHEMTGQERLETVLGCLDNARYLAATNARLAEAWSKRDPARSADYSRISDGWHAEAQRLENLTIIRGAK